MTKAFFYLLLSMGLFIAACGNEATTNANNPNASSPDGATPAVDQTSIGVGKKASNPGFTITAEEAPNKLFTEFYQMKSFDVNYTDLLQSMEQDLGGKTNPANTPVPGSVEDLYKQFQEESNKYSEALSQYMTYKTRLSEITQGLTAGTMQAAEAAKYYPSIHVGIEFCVNVMNEVKPKLDAIKAKYEALKGGKK